MVWCASDENLNRDSITKAANHTHHSVFWASQCVMGIPDIRWQMADVISSPHQNKTVKYMYLLSFYPQNT